MALFRRRRADDDDAAVTRLARDALARHGIEGLIAGAGTDDVRLEADGSVYPLYNLLISARGLSPRERTALIDPWVSTLISTAVGPDLGAMSPEEIRRRARTRLLPDSADSRIPTGGYQRQFGPGLAVVLCLDFPDTVMTLTDEQVAELRLPLDELFLHGAANTAREPIGSHERVVEDVWLVEGDSLFIASKVADMPALVHDVVGSAPFGVAFGVPFRGALLYWAVSSQTASLSALLSVTDAMASGQYGPLPGGVLDAGAWFWRDGEYQRIGGRGEDGLAVVVDGAFARALDEANAATPPQ